MWVFLRQAKLNCTAFNALRFFCRKLQMFLDLGSKQRVVCGAIFTEFCCGAKNKE